MAVTITRSIWIDDDGTGTTGTVINQALHTTLYNEIDTALAKVAQLVGGNAFTGNQGITSGSLTVAGTGPHTFSTGGLERLRIASDGTVAINTPNASPFGTHFYILSDMVNINGMVIQNSNVTNNGNLMIFANTAGGVAGTIQLTSATSVVYNTSSDARLKIDQGVAQDLASLRAVVVHDFTWTADGIRDRGVFAQEAHDLYPRAVSPGTDDLTESGTLARPWMTDYSKFVPDLIVGWQQHDADLTALRASLEALTDRVRGAGRDLGAPLPPEHPGQREQDAGAHPELDDPPEHPGEDEAEGDDQAVLQPDRERPEVSDHGGSLPDMTRTLEPVDYWKLRAICSEASLCETRALQARADLATAHKKQNAQLVALGFDPAAPTFTLDDDTLAITFPD